MEKKNRQLRKLKGLQKVRQAEENSEIALRPDVVKKTLLRSVKRYYADLFISTHRWGTYNKTDKIDKFKEEVDSFRDSMFPSAPSDMKQDITALLMLMICPQTFKR